jgi:hypothetical protein
VIFGVGFVCVLHTTQLLDPVGGERRGQVVKPGDVVVDATCGNGADSLALAHLALTDQSGKLYCIDIQVTK